MATLDHWIARVTARGVTYEPREDRNLGAIHVTERIRPLRRPVDVVRAEVTRLRASQVIRDEQVGSIEMITTAEGEYAALIAVRGTGVVDGCPLLFLFGFVFGEDFYNLVEGWMTVEARFAELEELVRHSIATSHLCLGSSRHRMFMYEPPPGWQGLARSPYLTEWYPLDYPRHRSRLSVAAAYAKKCGLALVETLMSKRLSSFQRADIAFHETINVGGMKGFSQLAVGKFPLNPVEQPFTHLNHIILMDQRYTQLLRLDTTEQHVESDRHMLYALLKTIRGIPSANAKAAEAMEWVID